MSKQAPVAPVTVASDLGLADLRAALAAGWADFAACPAYGIGFAAVYVVAGLGMVWALFDRGVGAWLLPAAAGFPLIAPFIAVGLYDVSRRRAAGLPIGWAAVLGALRGRGDEQILCMGGIVFVVFAFWIMLAHGIFAVFTADIAATTGMASHSLAMFATWPGVMLLMVGSAVGAVMALGLYAITVVSLPMLVDRDVDFVTAMIVSMGVVRSNGRVLAIWALGLAVALFVAMLPLFLGLLVVLPVLAHATWHLYRRAVTAPSVAL